MHAHTARVSTLSVPGSTGDAAHLALWGGEDVACAKSPRQRRGRIVEPTPDRPVSVWGGAYLATCPYLLSYLKCQAGRFERRAGRFECRVGWFECKVE